jgi:membrane protease YdiL (CAAX protease family)
MGLSDRNRAVRRYLAFQSAAACGIGLALGVLLLGIDAGGIATLIFSSPASDAPANLAFFLLGSTITFWPLAFATAVGILPICEEI